MAERPPFLAAHCRAARALLELTQGDLALAAQVGRMTVKRFEAAETVRPAQVAAIQRALELQGAVFLTDAVTADNTRLYIGVGLSPKKR